MSRAGISSGESRTRDSSGNGHCAAVTSRRLGIAFLVGPSADPDPVLHTLPRVKLLPPLNFNQLPLLARDASVLVMPYADLPVTRAIQPLKLKEYLATGRPVVARDLPATRDWSDCLDLADGPEAFSRAVRERLQTGLPDRQGSARRRLTSESWDAKAQEFERRIRGQESVSAMPELAGAVP